MHTTSTGSHRAFMVITVTLIVAIISGLVVGWRDYSGKIDYRQNLLRIDQELQVAGADLSSGAQTPPDNALPISIGYELPSSQTSASVPTQGNILPLPLEDTSPALMQAENLMATYWRTTDWRDRVMLVHAPDLVQPLMEDFYENQGGTDPVHGTLTSRGHYRINGVEVIVYHYTSNRPAGLEFALRKQADGRYLLDWESYVGYSEIAWQKLMENRPTAPKKIRAYCKVDDYYNFEFADAQRYLSIRLGSPDGDQQIHGYCERGSEIAKFFESQLAQQEGPPGYTLSISYPGNAQSSQCVIIQKIIAQRWITLP